MGNYSVSNTTNYGDKSFFGQMKGFLGQLIKEAKLDCFDLRQPINLDENSSPRCDVLLAFRGIPLLEVALEYQSPSCTVIADLARASQPIVQGPTFGDRLAGAIKESAPERPAEPRRSVQTAKWFLVWRTPKGEVIRSGPTFDLSALSAAFNALEDALITALRDVTVNAGAAP